MESSTDDCSVRKAVISADTASGMTLDQRRLWIQHGVSAGYQQFVDHMLSLRTPAVNASLGCSHAGPRSSLAPAYAEHRGPAGGWRPGAVSFEFFPPKDEIQQRQLWQTVRELESLGPDFVSVTYGASGASGIARSQPRRQ
jgi:hypothetical protein